MTHIATHDHTLLAHWTYTREEWKAFMRWSKMKKSYLHYFFHLLTVPRKIIPEIKVTPERVSIGENHSQFNGSQYQLKRVDVSDEGRINVLEFTYSSTSGRTQNTRQIRIPVPKGKLREAIEIVEKLQL